MKNNLNKFWVSFKQWYIYELPQSDLLKECFIGYDNFNYGTYYLDIDFRHYYKLNLGIEYDDSRLRKFNVPFSLKNGKLISRGYKSSMDIDYIYNYEQLERKIKYSEELIISEDLLDKKTALDYITDSLQYIISINEGEGVKKKNQSTALLVGNSKESKIYSVINNELEEINKIINEYFDIRHNEYLNKAKEKREVLNNKIFIEYLYNRIYSMLFILRLKCKNNEGEEVNVTEA